MNYTFTVNIPSYFVDNIKSTFSRLTGKEMTEEQFTDTMTGLIRDMMDCWDEDYTEEELERMCERNIFDYKFEVY